MNGDYEIHKPLVDNITRFDQLTEEITQNIELLGEYIEMLNGCKSKMGTIEDTRAMRRRMQTEITETNELTKKILELQQELGEIQFKKRKDIDNYNKISRRLNNTFEEYYDKFTKVLKEIHSREKIHLDIRQSLTLNASVTNYSASSDQSPSITSDQYANQEYGQQETLEEVRSNLDFYATIIEEREKELKNVRKIAAEINLLAQDQAKRIEIDAGDIENLVETATGAEKDTEKANKELEQAQKHQKSATKKNLIITCIIVIACLVVVAIVVSLNLQGSKGN